MIFGICIVLATLFVRESQCMDAEERALRSMERYMNIPPVPNTRLKLHRMSSFQVNHHFQCSQLCYLTSGCQSYNYRKQDGICELNNTTRDDSVFFTKTEEGWDHYERYSALISRALWYECFHANPCVHGSICVRKLLMEREPERPARSPLCMCREGFSGVYCEKGMSKYPMESKVACDAVQYGSSGSIWSPNYPLAYSSGAWCKSKVTVAEEHVVEFTFDPLFQLEHQRDCLYDYVQLSEIGTKINLGRYCGDNYPEGPIRSSGHEVTVEFRSDDTIVGSGFSVSWRTVLKDACTTKHTGTVSQYNWDLPPFTGSPFTFEVQASYDAHVLLAPLNHAADDDDMYMIIIGGWGGTKSRISRYSGSSTELVSTPDILSATQYKAFWISWDSDGTIAVGRGGETDPFMRWVDPNPLPIGHIGYTTGYGASGQWSFCPTVRHGGRPRDCSDVLKEGHDSSGIYVIYPYENGSGRSIGVFCDMDTDGGGWTVFQRRQDGSEDFYRGWADYKAGFGKLDGEFWLGNDKIHQLTSQAQYELRVDLEDFEGNSAYAQYQVFTVGSKAEHYSLTVGGYSGTAGDSMVYKHNGKPFSTKDRDYDDSSSSCALTYKGAWWYSACHSSNLNGLYHGGSHTTVADGVNWGTWKGHYYSLKHTEMKIRPIAN